jgi:hypothetical protein
MNAIRPWLWDDDEPLAVEPAFFAEQPVRPIARSATPTVARVSTRNVLNLVMNGALLGLGS